MYISTETPSARTLGDARMRARSDCPECDFCGRPVRRETAFERFHCGDEGLEVVLLCRECEGGTD